MTKATTRRQRDEICTHTTRWLMLFLFLTSGVRPVIQRIRTGDWGIRFSDRTPGHATLTSSLISFGSLGGIIAAALGTRQPERIDMRLRRAGMGAAAVATVLTPMAQWRLGESWRIGVDPDEKTGLVTDGVYAHIRNPIFLGMMVAATGAAIAVPSKWTVGSALVLLAGVEGQVRLVEEPYLRRVHGDAFDDYERASGRFLPEFF